MNKRECRSEVRRILVLSESVDEAVREIVRLDSRNLDATRVHVNFGFETDCRFERLAIISHPDWNGGTLEVVIPEPSLTSA